MSQSLYTSNRVGGELKVEIQLKVHDGRNSGLQFRSELGKAMSYIHLDLPGRSPSPNRAKVESQVTSGLRLLVHTFATDDEVLVRRTG